ncbi:MAG: DEAD/DEAH box helicase family protein [Albidovulum sp.]|nr:DEAD/DEAH box helicase family protein [Albidovulum sp.]
MTIETILECWRADMASADYSRTKAAGDAFERLCIAFLTHDPEQRLQYRNVRHFSDWARERGRDATDTGVDLVAELASGEGLAAIQCKFFGEGKTIPKSAIDSFLAASGTEDFTQRVIIDTTGLDLSVNLKNALAGQAVPVVRIGLHNFRASPIDWAHFAGSGEVAAAGPPTLRPHQEDAVRKISGGLAEARSRGKLIMACGTGKTLTALRAAERLAGKGGRVLYLVPSLALMSQTVHAWARDAELPLRAFAACSDSQVGKRKKFQDDNIDMDALDLAWPATTDAAKLAERARPDDPGAMTVIFATYQSSPVIERAQRDLGLPGFGLAVCDEAHRTAGAILDGEQQSHFTMIHGEGGIRAERRLYMTATPKVYAESARNRAGELAAALCSMDDEKLYGPVLYEIGFAEAVERGLLSDYRVVVLTVPEGLAARILAHYGGALEDGLKIDDTALMIGCWRALAKADPEVFPEHERAPMQRAIAFCRTIRASEQVERLFADLADKYRSLDPGGDSERELPAHAAPARHIDGTFNASRRADALAWLDAPGEDECRILTNARCLAEGVDLPALDGILFMHPRRSQIEVVQAVGRVMRKAEGKAMGYIILPIVVAPGASAENVLDDNERWRKVWQMLNAIRSHDEGFDAELNRIEMGEEPKHLSIVALSDWQPPSDPPPDNGNGGRPPPPRERDPLFKDLPGAIKAKIVEKCGSRRYWDEWAGDVSRIARAHVERIAAMVTVDDRNEGNADIKAAAEIFDDFVTELRDDLNPGIAREDAIEMLAQHMVTGPVFDALFGEEAFTARNPVSRAMQDMIDVIKPSGVSAEAESLAEFYESVRRRAKGAESDEARQRIIAELYDKFFRNAFAETSRQLGIVYTPVEIVDFILQSVATVLKDEFSTGFGEEGVHILDPFAGTGTFITRLLQSGLIDKSDLVRKYKSEIHANEIVLLAYYIASVNIETAFHGIGGGEYRPFGRICLADTFQLSEGDDLLASLLKDNSDRRTLQKERDIQVIVGNPPWMAGQKEHGYPNLYSRIENTYAARSSATLKNSLYDSYKLAIRWASDRIGRKGVIGFVTNGSWLDGNVDSGIRACLAEEFTSIHVLNLRGNQRTQGELSRREGGKVFGQGSRAPVAIAILARNPDKANEGCRILYRDIGDCLTREEKLEIVREAGSIAGIEDWREIAPDRNHDWIARQEAGFDRLYPLGSKAAKKGLAEETVFGLYSRGLATSRDAYIYNFSRETCAENARLMIEDYRAALAELGERPSAVQAKEAAARHVANIHWDQSLVDNLKQRKSVSYSPNRIWTTLYRPFVKQHCYVEYTLVNRKYQQDSIFPDSDTDNRAICVPGIGSTKPFSALMIDAMPDLELISKGQCFPRYRFERPSAPLEGGLLEDDSRERRKVDNVTDSALERFRTRYRDPGIGKDDIFDYVYGALHAPDFRSAFPNALARQLARIPLARDFWAFAGAVRELGELHLGYETCPEYPLELECSGEGEPQPEHCRLGGRPMKYAGKKGETDRSVLIVNEHVRLSGIPDDAHSYVVNGRTPLEWFIDRYRVSTDRKSGIVNDANEWFGQPEDLVVAIRRIVHLSVETARIVERLPRLFSDGQSK